MDDLTDTLAQVELVAGSDIWLIDHLAIMFGVLFVLVFVVAVDRSLANTAGALWARIAYSFQVVAAATIVVLIGIDGIGSKEIFDTWADATGSEREILDQIVVAVEHIDFGVFTTYVIVQYGLMFIALGLAFLNTDLYSRVYGIAAVVLGTVGTVTGIIWAFVGITPETVWIGFGTLLLLLVLVVLIGVSMLRKPTIQDA